jgi:hypothetical protein
LIIAVIKGRHKDIGFKAEQVKRRIIGEKIRISMKPPSVEARLAHTQQLWKDIHRQNQMIGSVIE